MSTMWQVSVDPGQCVGSAMCVGVAPERFSVDDGHSRPVSDAVPADDAVLAAAECCPMEAITITDVATGRRLFPAE